MTKDISIEDKMLIGCLKRKLDAGMDSASIMMLVLGICEILEKDK